VAGRSIDVIERPGFVLTPPGVWAACSLSQANRSAPPHTAASQDRQELGNAIDMLRSSCGADRAVCR